MSAGFIFSVPVASGGAAYKEYTKKIIRFIRHGCANRPFFHISVQEVNVEPYGAVIEQVGVYDPFPNRNNEKLACLNLNRIQYWIDNGAIISLPVKKLLGLAGYLPVHPRTYELAWKKRKLLMQTIEELEALKKNKAKSGNETGGGTAQSES